MSDLLGGLGSLGSLGGLMKSLTGIMPQDDPDTQLLKMQSEVSDLKKQENDLYIEIGKMAVAKYGPEDFGGITDRMKLIKANLAAAEGKLEEAKGAAEAQERANKEALAGRTCPQCGYENPEETKFCQECGSKLGAAKAICPSCGEKNPPGTRFCGGCGTKLEG